jgi:hypothetical protein
MDNYIYIINMDVLLLVNSIQNQATILHIFRIDDLCVFSCYVVDTHVRVDSVVVLTIIISFKCHVNIICHYY